MILSDSQIQELIAQPLSGEAIKEGFRIENDHKVHVTGEGYKDVLEDAIGETRTLQYGNRELKEPITKFLTKKIKDELSRWKNNPGTRKFYDFGDDKTLQKEFALSLQNVWKNGSITDFSYFINDALYTDFNGFAIIELGKIEDDLEIRDGIPYELDKTAKPYIIFKSIADVHDFRLSGRKVEYIILEYGKEIRTIADKQEDVILYRVIDDKYDYIYSQSSLGITEEDRIENRLGYVPAIQISDIRVTPLNDNVKTSHIYQTLPLLQDYMTRHAEHVISELIHASPILALMGQKCDYQDDNGHTCDGGELFIDGKFVKCPKCNGKGATVPASSSEVIAVPQTDKNGNTFSPKNIGQYITPPTEVLTHQSRELDELEVKVVYSGTGIKQLAKAGIRTATEIVINLKPLEDKIASLLDNIEAIETFVTNAVGELTHPDKYKGCEVHYGRKLNIRDENIILEEIETAKRAGMPVSHIRLLITELIMTRYQYSAEDLERALMLFELEPAAVFSPKEVQESEFYSSEVKNLKMNFDDFINRFELEYTQINLYMSGRPLKDRLKSIKDILDKYNEKSIAHNSEGSGDSDSGEAV